MIRVRIAPSPTGFLHIGTARTALFNYLFAKKNNGRFILRIEDTDLERSDRKYELDIFNGLAWLGIDADESPEIGGEYGPYRQSERIEIYQKYLEKLLKDGTAFYCPHSETELEQERTTQIKAKKSPLHICDARDKNLPRGIVRFKNTATESIIIEDIIRGEISFNPKLLGDFSLAKDAKTPLYNFAVVVDDELMKISHIIRGEDHISNTPKQILLIEALGFAKPAYAHLPLILGTDRSKLSKRHGAISIMEYRDAGYLPEALVNFMALLGWNPGDEREIFSTEELLKEFSLEKMQKSGAAFDAIKLDWMNGEYIRQKQTKELTELLLPYLKSQISNLKNFDSSYVEKIAASEQPRLKKLSEIGERAEYFFKQPEYDKKLLQWKNMSDEEIADSFSRIEKIISDLQPPIFKEKIEKEFLREIGDGDKGAILWPLRVALTGQKASPGPFEILEIMGRQMALERINAAKEKIQD